MRALFWVPFLLLSSSFQEKNGQIIGWRPHFRGRCPIVWEILDPPLLRHDLCTYLFQQVVDEENIQQKAHDLGTHMLLELAKIRDEVEIVGDVRGKGLMIGVEMVTDKVTMTMSNLSQSQWRI